jgi:hypothetical protein
MSTPYVGGYPWPVQLALALTAMQKGAAVLIFTGVVAPLIGLLLRRVGVGWDSVGGGRFAILDERPRRRAPGHREAIDAELRREVRQLVVARNERRLRQGLEPFDVEAETDRQLADLVGSR